MKTVIVALAILLAAAAAHPAFARRHDDFERKDLREQRAERQGEKAAIEEERVEEKEKTQARTHAKPHPQERRGHSSLDDGGDLDAD